MLVFDATPLIYLAKAGRLDVTTCREGDCVVPAAVETEAVETGLQEGHPDARRIANAIDAGRFAVREAPATELHDRLLTNEKLSRADAAVLATAAAEDGTAVMDEQYGRDVAAAEGIGTTGTAALVVHGIRTGDLDTDEARRTIDEMVDAGWHCSPSLYAQILRKIDDIGDE